MQSRKGKEIHLLIEKKENPNLKSYRVFWVRNKNLLLQKKDIERTIFTNEK